MSGKAREIQRKVLVRRQRLQGLRRQACCVLATPYKRYEVANLSAVAEIKLDLSIDIAGNISGVFFARVSPFEGLTFEGFVFRIAQVPEDKIQELLAISDADFKIIRENIRSKLIANMKQLNITLDQIDADLMDIFGLTFPL